MDPDKFDQNWQLSGALAILLAYRVFDRIRLQDAQAKLLDSREKLQQARKRVRMTLLEHKRTE